MRQIEASVIFHAIWIDGNCSAVKSPRMQRSISHSEHMHAGVEQAVALLHDFSTVAQQYTYKQYTLYIGVTGVLPGIYIPGSIDLVYIPGSTPVTPQYPSWHVSIAKQHPATHLLRITRNVHKRHSLQEGPPFITSN